MVIVVNQFPRGKTGRKHAPLTTRLHEIENVIPYLTQILFLPSFLLVSYTDSIVLFFQRIIELRPIFIQTMEALLAIVHNYNACTSIADKCTGILIHFTFKSFPIIFFHDFTIPIVTNDRLRLLGKAFCFKYEVMLSILCFKNIGKRWIVERTFSWFDNYRRLCRNYEFTFDSAEEMVKLAAIRMLLSKI